MDEQPKKVWTYEDLAAMPDDGNRYEILDGELFVTSAPAMIHQWILGQLYSLLRAKQGDAIGSVWFAPVDVVLAPTRVVEPDIIVLRTPAKLHMSKKHIDFVPDLVMEVLSPSNQKHDRLRKRRFYARCRVPEYWIVDPESSTVQVLALIEDGLSYREVGWYGPGDRVRSATFDRLELAIDDIFPPADDDDADAT
jgi:Uma2 family endonuclease